MNFVSRQTGTLAVAEPMRPATSVRPERPEAAVDTT